ncbi:hypothetical protein [Qipengyuania flava]|uniref:hypothetical protein n=1 Tax=Qipengyuania flava TaxID=192812 RepID=UPI001C627751|nr:hypothetical protein [Qipengyuania flava]QYJ06580.1 hypothetical protein KUV82_10970 [Qipengyuania flava]
MKTPLAILGSALALAGCQTYGAEPAPTTAVASAGEAPPHYVTAICGECHAVTDNAVSPNPQAPGFADIANSPGLTRATLVTFLSDAHNYPMQMDVDLVEEDIETIADYMMTLQSEDYVKRPG